MGNVVEADIIVHCALFGMCIDIEHLPFEAKVYTCRGSEER